MMKSIEEIETLASMKDIEGVIGKRIDTFPNPMIYSDGSDIIERYQLNLGGFD